MRRFAKMLPAFLILSLFIVPCLKAQNLAELAKKER